MGETIQLTQEWLGFEPYALIKLQMASDGSGDPAVFLTAGGGAEDEPLYLPLMVLIGRGPEGNPVAEMLRDLWAVGGDARIGIEQVARQFNADWLPFVQGGA